MNGIGRGLLLALLGSLPLWAGAAEPEPQSEWEWEPSWDELNVTLTGHSRSIYSFGRELRTETFFDGSARKEDTWRLLSRLRSELEANYGDHWFGEAVFDVEGRTGTGLRTLAFDIGDEVGYRTWVDADHTFSEHRDFDGRYVLYRGWMRYDGDEFALTLGRQRIPLGRGRLWTPTDLFNPIPPLAIEGDQRIGQDSVLARWRFSDSLWTDFIWSRESDPDLTKSALRLEWVRTELDLAAMAGRFDHDYVLAFDFAANLIDAAVRGEVTYTNRHPDDLSAVAGFPPPPELDDDDFWQIVVSLDYTFPVGAGLYGLVEHLYNGNRIPGGIVNQAAVIPPALQKVAIEALAQQTLFFDRITTKQLNLTGFSLGYEFNPLIRTDLLGIQDWGGPSSALFPQAVLTLTDDVQLSLGAQFFLRGNDEDAEYSDRANLFFVQLDAFF